MARQFEEIASKVPAQQEPYNFSALTQIINNSSDTDCKTLLKNPLDTTSTLGQAMNTFRKDFTALAMKEIFFNPQHLIKAYEVYTPQFGPWSMEQLSLFWSQVIGYIQRFLPACYAQAFCQSLYNVAKNKEQRLRTLKLENYSKLYFPLHDSAGPGFNFAVYSYFSRPGCALGGSPNIDDSNELLKNYVEQIHQNFLNLHATCNMSDSPSRTATP